jgi:hypothetical protein
MDDQRKPFFNTGYGVAVAWGAAMAVLFVVVWSMDSGMQFDWELAAAWYLGLGAVMGILAAIGLFFWCWWYGANKYGALGFLFGWIPGGVLGFVAGWAIVPLWSVILIGLSITRPRWRLRAPS